MIVLGLDTTGGHCTAALVKGQTVLAETSELIGRGHAERLAPMVQDIMRNANITATDIDRISVCTGPGSFTGLRVALAFAKGFALPRNISVIGIPALEVLAAQADPTGTQTVLSVMDVRRQEVCWGVYEKGQVASPPQTQAIDLARRDIAHMSYDVCVGDGAGLVENHTKHTIVSGSVLARLAQVRTPETSPAMPLYSRAPDAKLPGGLMPS